MKTKIYPINYTDDLENLMKEENCNAIGIESMSITYTQPADTNSHQDEIQTITISTDIAASVSNEDAQQEQGFYFNITIPENQHWSVDDGDSLKALIEDFKKRLYMSTQYLNK